MIWSRDRVPGATISGNPAPGAPACALLPFTVIFASSSTAHSPGDRRMMLTLYYAPMTCALVPYVTLTEAVADFDVQNVNTRSGQNHGAEFLRINPKHKVPVLLID